MSPPDLRRLVLDEDMNWKLAKELQRRGLLNATSNKELELLGKKDGALIKALSQSHEPCVLVAWDNRMMKAHAAELQHFGLTVAVVDKKADRGGLTDEQYYREVIHRWAHLMKRQAEGSVVKYNRLRYRRVDP